jgi:methionine-rich copper-binding protein CopC
MTRMTTLLAMLLCLASAGVEAHARLKSSSPADASTVAAPDSVTLVFSEAAKVTSLTLHATGEANARKIAVPADDEAASHTIPLPKLAPGAYVLTWRALSDDTHVTSGTVRFTVRP